MESHSQRSSTQPVTSSLESVTKQTQSVQARTKEVTSSKGATKLQAKEHHRKDTTEMKYRPFVPMFLMALTLVLIMAFQTLQVLKDYQNLQVRFEGQENTLREAKKVRIQLDAIAKQTYQLSVNGNVNAVQIVTKMKKAGFTFNQE